MLTAVNLGAAWIALGKPAAALELLADLASPAAPPELHANLAFVELHAGQIERARASLQNAFAAGADARNPRMVALGRLIWDAEGAQREDAMAAVADGPR